MTLEIDDGRITDTSGGSDVDKIYNAESDCRFTGLEACEDFNEELECSGVSVGASAFLVTSAVLLLLIRLW